MPTVQTEAHLAAVEPVGLDYLQSRVWTRETGIVIVRYRILKIVGTAEIVLSTCAADGWIVRVTVHIELDFAFAPPTAVVDTPGEIGAHIIAAAADAINNCVYSFIRQGIHAAELCVKIITVFRNVC